MCMCNRSMIVCIVTDPLSLYLKTYYRERVFSLSEDQAKAQLLETFIPLQAIFFTYYPVKVYI